MAKVLQSIVDLSKKTVLVGVPEAKAQREDGEPVNNAALAYIHEFGSPANNIPPRPFLIPGIESAKSKIAAQLAEAGKAALNKDNSAVDKRLNAAGLAAQNSAKTKINSGDFAPLSDSTVRARAARGRKGAIAELASRKAGNEANNENARPLIDSGQLRNSITYVIRKK